jgi:large repetitive protein
MTRYTIFLTVVLCCLLAVSCSDDTTKPADTIDVSGFVRSGSTGDGMEGATIIAFRHGSESELTRTLSAADGSFILTGLPRVAIDLLVEKSGYTLRRMENVDPAKEQAGDGATFNVRLNPTSESCCSGVLTLTVKDEQGAPVADAKVMLKKDGKYIDDARSNESGLIVFEDLCAGSYSLRIVRDGFAVLESAFVINEQCDAVSLTATMQSVQTCCNGVLTLTVKTLEGANIADASVQLLKGGGIVRSGVTNAAGQVIFDSLCAGKYGVVIEKQGYPLQDLSFTINENCDPVVKVIALKTAGCCTAVFTLTVRDKSGAPLSGAVVQVKTQDGAVAGNTVTDQNGLIQVNDLCEGKHSYRVTKDGYKVAEGYFIINESCDPVSLEATLEQSQSGCCTGVFTLLLKDASGNPVQGVKVLVKKGGTVVGEPKTNESGSITLDGLCAGQYTWWATAEGWKTMEGSFVINENCDPVSLTATLEQTQTVCCDGIFTLTVRDEQGAPVKNARVYVRKGGTVVADVFTDANGQIEVKNLCASLYSWKIMKDGYEIDEGSFSINEQCDPVSRERTLTTATVCCTATLTVSVVDASNNAVVDAMVKLWQDGAIKASVLTDANGKAVFTDLCKGSYGVDVSKTGFRTKEFTIKINEKCDPVNKTIELIP